MKKIKLLRRPTRVSDISFDDLTENTPDSLDLKIERFMSRHRRLQEE